MKTNRKNFLKTLGAGFLAPFIPSKPIDYIKPNEKIKVDEAVSERKMKQNKVPEKYQKSLFQDAYMTGYYFPMSGNY